LLDLGDEILGRRDDAVADGREAVFLLGDPNERAFRSHFRIVRRGQV
jgi:hypothetical protein